MAERRRIAVLTTGRQDYGILRSTLVALARDPRFELRVWAGGMHLSAAHGRTVDRIRADGLEVARELPFAGDGADPLATGARAIEQVGAALTEERPSALVLLGDRSETLAAAYAATLRAVPIVHLHGGEESEGAIDNAMRHAITKLAHLHLVSHEVHAERVRQMGEPSESVRIVGAAGLDNLYRDDLPDRVELAARLGISLEGAPAIVVTMHPTTLREPLDPDPAAEARAVAAAVERTTARLVVTQPNDDAGGAAIRAFWREWARGRADVAVVDALGERAYWGLLRIADVVLGNSSSGIIEAPAAGAPVIDVGDRQKGRLRSPHVEHVPADTAAIAEALARALSPGRREALAALPPLYPRGPASARIVAALAEARLPTPPRKAFVDRPAAR